MGYRVCYYKTGDDGLRVYTKGLGRGKGFMEVRHADCPPKVITKLLGSVRGQYKFVRSEVNCFDVDAVQAFVSCKPRVGDIN